MKYYFKQLFSRNCRSAIQEPATHSAKNPRLNMFLTCFSLWLLTVAPVFATTCTNGFPQAVFPLQCGMAVATCAALANGGVNTNGYVVAVSDIRNPAVNSPGLGLNWCAPMLHNELAYQPLGFQSPTNIWNAANLGQVFGVMLDDAANPNIYVAATRIYGVAQFGFGGPGAVYKLNGTTGVPTLFAQLTNSGPALGNLCYDPVNKQVFVSNFEDGLIYRYTAAGTFVDTFDHGVNGRPNAALAAIADSGILGQATVLGRRVFGVQVHNNRVYYSVWAEDSGLSSATTTNEIWSVALTPTGGFNIATAQLEIQVPQYAPSYSNPVADINFSANGKMLLAERTTYSSSSTLFFAGAHSSRIIEYQFSGTQWVPSANNFYIGEWIQKNNCTGGADYNCAGEVVGTGDGVKLDSEVAYGIAILPAGGNTPATVATGSYIIDLNGTFGTQDKTQIGEVAVVKNCCECVAISNEALTCGTNGTYTYTFNITNQFTGPIGYLSFLEVPTNITVTPNSPIPLQPPLLPGQGTTVTVTIANASGLTNFCFLLSAHDTNLVNCCSIRRCVALPNCCALVVKESIICNPTNSSQLNWSFSLLNQSGNPVSYVFLVPNTPCATANPSIIALTPPLPSGSSTGLTTTVNVTGNCGTNACFLISLHNSNVVQCCSFLHCIPLSCKTNNHLPTVECPASISQCKSNSTPITVNAFVTDADGDPLTVTWKVDNLVVQVDNVPAGSPTAASVGLVFTFSPGLHTVNICVSDGNSPQVICTTTVEIGDKTPPQVKCPPDRVIIGFQGTIPAITNLVVASDNCTPTNQLVITQKPPPGTVVGVGTNCITVTVQDAAGNIATCQTCIIVSPIAIDPNIGLNPFTAPADIPVTVQTDPKLTASVAYFANGAPIGTSIAPRFAFTWTKVPAGSYELSAHATSITGDTAISEPAFLVVNPAPGGVPGTVGPLLRNPALNDGKASFSLGTVKGEVCYIEFTESLEPANWQVLETLVGDGNLRTVQDPITNVRQRFYRVRLDPSAVQQRQQ